MKPMLAVNIEVPDIRYPLYASAKLDGVRGVVVDGQLRSRSLKPIPNPHVTALFSRPELDGYDGELVLGAPTAPDVFRQTVGATSREKFEPPVKFYVFDNFKAQGGFQQRMRTLQEHASVVLLEQRYVETERELLLFEDEMLTQGYEGLILRSPTGLYKFGRSTAKEQSMLKLKRFTDSEAEVLEVIEEQANTNVGVRNELGRTQRSTCKSGMVGKGCAGAMRVRDIHSGVEFMLGVLGDADSEWFWTNRDKVPGRLVKYKSFLVGAKDKPRFPIYLGGRETWDLS